MRAGVRAGVGGAPRRASGVAHSGRDRQSTAKIRCGLALQWASYKLALGAPQARVRTIPKKQAAHCTTNQGKKCCINP
eukprot:scaffold18655_cov61-Phaeocystis_antarctica.AAC.4